MHQLAKLGTAALSTVFLWFGVWMIQVVMGDSGLVNFAAVMAVVGSLILWLAVGIAAVEQQPDKPAEKAKRQPDQDARLALLLSMLDAEERTSLKRRLIEELTGDGESIPLSELLDDHENVERYHVR